MENKLMEIIYDSLQDLNFYNYDNDERLENICIGIYDNVKNERVIDIMLENETYTLQITKSFVGVEKELIDND